MPDNVSFEGFGPYPLPVAQRATASTLNGSVEMRLYALIDGDMRAMVIQMAPEIARDLGSQLMDAAGQPKE